MSWSIAHIILFIVIPLLFSSTVLYVFFHQDRTMTADKKYRVHFKLKRGKFLFENIREVLQ